MVITGDDEIAELNRDYLGRSGPTNVIAFSLTEGEFSELRGGMLGDVVVSLPYAVNQARENGLDPKEHFVRLLIHGILHLLGYDHEHDQNEAARMEKLTEELLIQSAPGPGEDDIWPA